MTARTAEKKVLLTGFGPFGEIESNPSERVVHPLGAQLREIFPSASIEIHELEVRPGVIESFCEADYDAIVCLGVDRMAEALRVERHARNFFWDRFQKKEGSKILESEPETAVTSCGPLPKTLPESVEGFRIEWGNETSAGDYVCNDTLFRAGRKHRAAYFIHLPNVPVEDDRRLVVALTQIIESLLRAASIS